MDDRQFCFKKPERAVTYNPNDDWLPVESEQEIISNGPRMNILIIRLSAIGDIFFCTSLLSGLRQRYPGCRISWVTEPLGSTILKDHPLLDRMLVLPRRDWVGWLKGGRLLRLAGSLKAFDDSLRREHYDLVIDPQGLLKSAIWARRARADYRIGIHAREGSRFLYDEDLRLPQVARPPILSEYRQLLKRLGGGPGQVGMSLHFSHTACQEAAAFLEQKRIQQPLVFCPFTTRPQKHWFPEDWSRLGDLVRKAGLGPVLILGGPGDGEAARGMASGMEEVPVVSAGEPRSIQFALALISMGRALVGVDTGLTHAGIGLGKPTLGLFGSTCPYLETRHDNARILYHAMPCSPCHRKPTCDGRFDCMRQHTPENVLEQLRQILL